MGVSTLALQGPSQHLSADDVTAGLGLPYAAVRLMGYNGAVATTLMMFMAITSAFSAQLISVSSILTYDIYQAYIEPRARGKKLVWISHVACVLYAVLMAGFATGLYYAGIGMGYLYLLMGVIISSAVFPGAMTLLCKGQTWIAAAVAPVLGLAVSLVAWLVTIVIHFCGSLETFPFRFRSDFTDGGNRQEGMAHRAFDDDSVTASKGWVNLLIYGFLMLVQRPQRELVVIHRGFRGLMGCDETEVGMDTEFGQKVTDCITWHWFLPVYSIESDACFQRTLAQ